MALNTQLPRLVFARPAAGIASCGVASGWGLLHHLRVPFWIAVPDPPVLAALTSRLPLNARAMFNHGAIRIPGGLDRVPRRFVVTPAMHRAHHSVDDDEADSHFSFDLPWWDRLLDTCRAQRRAGREAMTIGIHGHRDPREVARLDGLLWLPLRGEVGGCAISRRDWRGEHVDRSGPAPSAGHRARP